MSPPHEDRAVAEEVAADSPPPTPQAAGPSRTSTHSDEAIPPPSSSNSHSLLDEEKSNTGTPPLLAAESATFITAGDKPVLRQSVRLRIIPAFAIAFLDIANSGDFAANVFNEIPVPVYATVLMVLGATCALIMSYVAFRDARRSWENIKLLRQERQILKAQAELQHPPKYSYAVELDLNHRDFWTEVVDRFCMEVMMGIAAFLIAVGTYMAPAGANHRVFQASNLLSGYIGNAPPAAYGLVTCSWSFYVLLRIHRQSRAAKVTLTEGPIRRALLTRFSIVREHAVLTGVTCLLSGALSMITPTHWWPYPILAVCGLTFIYGTYVYRTQIGYKRPQMSAAVRMDKDGLLDELAYVYSIRAVLASHDEEKTTIESYTMASLLDLIVRCDLFETFATHLSKDGQLSSILFAGAEKESTIFPRTLSALPVAYQPRLREIAIKVLKSKGPSQLSFRKRFLLESLGSALAVSVYTPREQERTK